MKKKILLSSPTVHLLPKENYNELYIDNKFKGTLKKSFQLLDESILLDYYFQNNFVLYSWDDGLTLEYRNNNICIITGYQAGLTPNLYLIFNGCLYGGPYKVFDRVTGGCMRYKVDVLEAEIPNPANKKKLSYIIQPENGDTYLIQPLQALITDIWPSTSRVMTINRILKNIDNLTIGDVVRTIWDLMEEERSPLRNKNDMKKLIKFVNDYPVD